MPNDAAVSCAYSDALTTNPDTFDLARLDRFRALVRHANANSPYYSRLIIEHGIDIQSCIPTDFPVLTKAMLMANYDDIVTNRRITKQGIADFLTHSSDPGDLLFNKYTVMHTSGTSGEVGYFLTDSADSRRTLMNMRRNRVSMRANNSRGELLRRLLRLRRLRMAFYGATGGHYAGVTMVARMQRGLPRLFVRADGFEVNSPLPGVVEGLNKAQPDMLLGYTTALKILGEQQQAGALHIAPLTIAATGETVTKEDMVFLSESFGGAHVVSVYGCTEHGMMGFSNPDRETMTLNEGSLIWEFYPDHSIVTNLNNYTMPLIRYRMSDIIRPISAPGEHPIIVENLVGRSEQMPTFKNTDGKVDFISPHTINEIFVSGVTRFQMQLTSESSFRFPICVDAGLGEAEQTMVVTGVTKRLQEILQQKELDNVTFEVPVVDEIPLNAHTRKFQLIVDNRKESPS